MRHTKRTNSRSRRRKPQKTRRNKQQKGGRALHYIISAHGSSKGISDYDMTPTLPVLYETHGYDILLYSYVREWNDFLLNDCAMKLQYYLTYFRGDPSKQPDCLDKGLPHINHAIKNIYLSVEPKRKQDEQFVAGIIDVSTIGNKNVVKKFNSHDHGIHSNYRLSDAIETIRSHAETTYGTKDNIKIHILSCM